MKDQVWSENSLSMTCFHIAYSLCHILGAFSYKLLLSKQMIIGNSWLGLANTLRYKGPQFLVSSDRPSLYSQLIHNFIVCALAGIEPEHWPF
jgi:hypothetical protein